MTMNRYSVTVGRLVYHVNGNGMKGTIIEVSPDGCGVQNIRVRWEDRSIESVARKNLRLTPPGTRRGTWLRKGYLG